MTKIREGNNKMFFFIGDNCFCRMLWMEEVERSGIRYYIFHLYRHDLSGEFLKKRMLRVVKG